MTEDLAAAQESLNRLEDLGIELEHFTDRLLREGIDKFIQPFDATYRAIDACVDTPGLVKISAGNYGGRLGKSFIQLHGRDEVSVPT